MARGAEEKELVSSKILEMFEGAFVYGKEIRVPVNGVQIKVSLTCAKDNVEISGVATPAAVKSDDGFPAPVNSVPPEGLPWDEPAANEPTPEELENVRILKERLGL